MKILITLFIMFLAIIFCSKAQSDTLLINMKKNQIEKILLSQIQKIQFENITFVENDKHYKKGIDIKGNNPNPFSEQTNIEFEIASAGNVDIFIYDNNGNQIQKLECNNYQAGKNTLQWNCMDKNNNRVLNGIYYYEVRFNNEIHSQKMILVK